MTGPIGGDRHRTATPVLWLCGPSGVGKSEVGWQIFSGLRQAGIEAGYIDIDQLGMCYPEPADDPRRYRLEAQNLDAVVGAFAAEGIRCVVVSGVVDPAAGVPGALVPHTALTLVRLAADRDELAHRLAGRQGSRDGVEDALRESAIIEASGVGDLRIDTTGKSVAEVVRLVRSGISGWPGLAGADPPSMPSPACTTPPPSPASTGTGRVLLICGVTGVGKSAVGFEVYVRGVRAGHTGAYVDLGQISSFRPPPAADPGNHRLKARALTAIWPNYQAAGASSLVAVGPVEDERAARAYAQALPAATITVCRLRAGRVELTRRVTLRGQGSDWNEPGDPLLGQPAEYLREVAARAAAADGRERAAPGELRIDTDGRSVGEVADLVCAAAGWPGI